MHSEWRHQQAAEDKTNTSQEGYYNSINPLVEGVPHIFTGLHLGASHIFTGLKYSGASGMSHTYFPVVQFIGLQYSVLDKTAVRVSAQDGQGAH